MFAQYDDPEITIWVVTREDMAYGNLNGHIQHHGVVPAGFLFDGGQILRDYAGLFTSDEALLILPTLPGDGTDEEPASSAHAWARFEASVMNAGWMPGTAGQGRHRETGWITCRDRNGRKIHIGILDRIDQNKTPLFDIREDSAATIVSRIWHYGTLSKVLWRMSAGVTGCASIRENLHTRAVNSGETKASAQPYWRWDECPANVHGAGQIVWERDLTPAERHGRLVQFDVRSQYLAAAQAALLGWGKPVHRATDFAPEKAGFWKIYATPLVWPGKIPMINESRIDPEGFTWVTSPVMTYLAQRSIFPQVHDAYVSPTASAFLKPWASRFRDGLNVLALQHISPTIKRTYAETVGMMKVQGGSIYRPDWHWTILDLARVNFLRKLDKGTAALGRPPVSIYHDAVSYVVDGREDYQALAAALGVEEENVHVGKLRLVKDTAAADWKPRPRFVEREDLTEQASRGR